MKINVLACSMLLLSLFGMSLAVAQNGVGKDGGDLDNGQKVLISEINSQNADNGFVMYTKPGTSGLVKFSCEVFPTDSNQYSVMLAKISPARNFQNGANSYTFVEAKHPIEIAWVLTDEQYAEGAVTVTLSKGDSKQQGYVQCKTISTSKK